MFGAHDFGDSSGNFEDVYGVGAENADFGMNHLAVVVNQTSVAFYRDGTLQVQYVVMLVI